MENLVLLSVVRALHELCCGRPLLDARQDAAHRLRLVFDCGAHRATVVVSLMPELPWIGRPGAPPLGRRAPGPFAGAVRRALGGVTVVDVRQPPGERIVVFEFAGGQALIAELRPQRSNLLLLDPRGTVHAAFRRPGAAASRWGPGVAWQAPNAPAGRPKAADAALDEVRRALDAGAAAGEAAERTLVRRLFGVGPVAARLVAREAGATGADLAAVLAARIEALGAGDASAVADLPGGPAEALAAAEEGRLDPAACRLWPWAPIEPPAAGSVRVESEDGASTVGAYYEAVERATVFRRRAAVLEALMSKEAARLAEAVRRAEADLAGFADPERPKRQAEALLAAGPRARRDTGCWVVPDPYAEDGAELRVPSTGGESLHAMADALYKRHRRACRGLERSRARARDLAERLTRLQALRRAFEATPDAAGLAAYEQSLRDAGVPIGLESRSVRRKTSAGDRPPRLEGVRLYTSRDGLAILAGRTARGNDRLTFKLSSPTDFWFHARDCPGAHVVVRNDAHRPRPPEKTLVEAAAIAAWWSDKRGDAQVDVQWTQRKNVRRVRGGPPGAVVLKRAATVRVVPALPTT